MSHLIILAFVAFIGLANCYSWPNRPPLLKATKPWKQRLRYPELKHCREHSIKTDYAFSDFISLDQPSDSFRFFTFTKKDIQFQLSFAPRKADNLFTATYLKFVIADNTTSIFNSVSTNPVVVKTPNVIQSDDLNEVEIRMDGQANVTISVNGVKFVAPTDTKQKKPKTFRYISFAASSPMDFQEFMYDCDDQKPFNPLKPAEPIQPAGKLESEGVVRPAKVPDQKISTEPNQIGSSTQPAELDDELNDLYRYLKVKPEDKDSLDKELDRTYGKPNNQQA